MKFLKELLLHRCFRYLLLKVMMMCHIFFYQEEFPDILVLSAAVWYFEFWRYSTFPLLFSGWCQPAAQASPASSVKQCIHSLEQCHHHNMQEGEEFLLWYSAYPPTSHHLSPDNNEPPEFWHTRNKLYKTKQCQLWQQATPSLQWICKTLCHHPT